MKRFTRLSLCTAVALWLLTCGVFAPSGSTFGEDPPKKVAEKVPAKVAKIPAQPPPKVPVRAEVDENQMKQFEDQYLPQFRQLQRVELHFLRSAAQPTKAQYDKIAADSEPALKTSLRSYVEQMFGVRRLGGGTAEHFDARKTLTDAIAKAAHATLPPEQAARYQKELDERAAARKHAVVLGLVAHIDKALVLTAEQRGKLTEILRSEWRDSWNHTQYFFSGGMYLPAMPDDKIVPLLTEKQKTTWNGISRGQVHFGIDLGFVNWMVVEEENPEEAQPEKPAAGEGNKKNAKPAEVKK